MAMHIMSHSFHIYVFVIDVYLLIANTGVQSVLILHCFSICVSGRDNLLKIRLNLRIRGNKLFNSSRDRLYLSLESEERIEQTVEHLKISP